MSFLGLEGKTFLVMGVANKRSVAYHVGRTLEDEGATVVYSVRSAERARSVARLLEGRDVHVCDVQDDEEVRGLATAVGRKHSTVHGIVHSIAFANYEGFSGKFHEVGRRDFLQAVEVSCYSLIAVANAFKGLLDERASVVTIGISTTRMTVESYGYMAPAKAALESSVAFLAKSFSRFSKVRFNAVGAGLLKTSASAGIPGYVDNYLFAEQATLRKGALTTQEVANAAVFLLSERAGGINAQTVVVDCGMGTNYFDADIVKHTVTGAWPADRKTEEE
ncbi:MAG TPA: SDR family oxidoreductase [Phycisphaerae bacterium]|nr:SDR family oxidoreductase [Phycisphaerae bacterium]